MPSRLPLTRSCSSNCPTNRASCGTSATGTGSPTTTASGPCICTCDGGLSSSIVWGCRPCHHGQHAACRDRHGVSRVSQLAWRTVVATGLESRHGQPPNLHHVRGGCVFASTRTGTWTTRRQQGRRRSASGTTHRDRGSCLASAEVTYPRQESGSPGPIRPDRNAAG